MALRPTLLPQTRLLLQPGRRYQTAVCPLCSLTTRTGRVRSRIRRNDVRARRWQTTTPTNPRVELERTLLELQRQTPHLLESSRLQLALSGLRQAPGEEVVRIAVLGLAGGGTAAKRVLRALLADPLKDEEAWERELEAHDVRQPLIVRIAPSERRRVDVDISADVALRELHVSCPELNELSLELLLMQISAPYGAPGDVSVQSLERAVLVPAVAMPSAAHGASPTMAPVHRALLIAEGIMGAVNVSALPVSQAGDAVRAAVHIEGASGQPLEAAGFDVVDVSLAEAGVRMFRQGPQKAMDYERLWFASKLPALKAWLKAGAQTAEDAAKPAVRQLVASLLRDTLSSIQAADARGPSTTLHMQSEAPALGVLNERLAEWAQRAHAELQDELDLAFTGRRWRKLGWWKLFWRVDDVAMLTNEMLSRRFMPTAEQELIYLAGRIAELGHHEPHYPQPTSSREDDTSGSDKRGLGSEEDAPVVAATTSLAPLPKWPGHIAFTRRYLQNETVPALQALAQRLVLQSLGTSGATTSLAALLYISSLASTLYEAGAVAALGIVYSLGRLQKKWETARSFWEGEVREEGRKAVRGAEESVSMVLQNGASNRVSEREVEDLRRARDLVARAEGALARIK